VDEERQRDRETERQRDRETERQRDPVCSATDMNAHSFRYTIYAMQFYLEWCYILCAGAPRLVRGDEHLESVEAPAGEMTPRPVRDTFEL
jgi:hypothetical protein